MNIRLCKAITVAALKSLWPNIRTIGQEPKQSTSDYTRFIANLFGHTTIVKGDMFFENHCHTHFSDGPELGDVVNTLISNGTKIVSITDHNTTLAFDSLADGTYDLNDASNYRETGKPKVRYSREIHKEGRSMTITCGDRELILLRSIELTIDQKHLGVHGTSSLYTEKELSLEQATEIAKKDCAFMVANHPFGPYSLTEEDIVYLKKAGVTAIEKNGACVLPIMFGTTKAEVASKHHRIPLITTSDAHILETYGRSGILFDENQYGMVLIQNNGDHINTIKTLIEQGKYKKQFNYHTLAQAITSFRKCVGN